MNVKCPICGKSRFSEGTCNCEDKEEEYHDKYNGVITDFSY